MPRRHRPPESVHVMRWMVSWADFITLLFAFFVVLYAVSSVNEQKFEALAESLSGGFEGPDVGQLPAALQAIFPLVNPLNRADVVDQMADRQPQPVAPLSHPLDDTQWLKTALLEANTASTLSVIESDDWVHVEIPSDQIFNAQTDVISQPGGLALNQLAKVFLQFSNAINVEVFTHADPQETVIDENLWQLSAMQAAAVSYHLIVEGVDPARLAGVAYGPYQPIATVEDEEGQALNRRLVFLIDRTSAQRQRIKTVTERHLSAKPNR